MKDQRIVRWIESKYQGLADAMSERTRRRWAAVEAVSLGRGGIAAVSAATGVAPSTIRRGIRELHPDRDAQVRFIGRRVRAQQRAGQPAVSVDTKKKETLGNLKNAGRTWRPRGRPREVETHDFPDPTKGKAVPYGVYDLRHDEAWVSVGIGSDTAEFAVESIQCWWKRLGRRR